MARRGEDFYKAVGERVRKLREDHGWTQEQLADAIGMEPANLSRYETGRRSITLDALRRIAAELHVSVVALLDDKDRRPAPEGAGRGRALTRMEQDVLAIWNRVPRRRRKLGLKVLGALADA